MAYFPLLEPREEDELHKSRLLNVEEKPFKRISKRLLAPSSLLYTSSQAPTSLSSSLSNSSDSLDYTRQKTYEERRQFKEDILLDFSAFDSSLVRIQFLRNSNERERERYMTDKARILNTAQYVRESTAQLRIQLDQAKQTLEQRKKFDELAEKITGNRLLRPREDQMANLKKLEEECRELERESKNYKATWAERREQFGRIVEEGMQLRRLIRDEKEEVERREGMAEDEDGESGDSTSRGGQTPRHHSENGTPRYQNGRAENTGSNGAPGIRVGISGSTSRPASRSENIKSLSSTEKRLERNDINDTVMLDIFTVNHKKKDSEIFETGGNEMKIS